MAITFEFIDNGKSFNINFNSIQYTAGKNDVELVIPDITENNELEIRSNSAKFTDVTVYLDTDTILGIGAGSTTATELRDALELIFFLDEGGGGGTTLQERIIVNQSNFATALGGTIDSTKEYFLDGKIDTGTTQITIPSTGINLTGYNFDVSGLFSTEDNYTMFVSDVGGSGNFIGKDYDISVSGTNSKVYDLVDATGVKCF